MKKGEFMAKYDDLSRENLIKIIKEQEEKIAHLSLVIAMKNARTFKPKAETIDPEEHNLFNYNEAEALSSTTLDSELESIKTSHPKKTKSKNHSEIDFEKFVTNTIVHDPSKGSTGTFEKVSQDVTYKVHVSLDVQVDKHVYLTLKQVETNTLITEPRDFCFNNSVATPSLVSYIANEKYLMGTPLYRQESAFLSTGLPLSRVNLSNYLIKGAAVLYPMYVYLKHLLIHNQNKVLHADETTLKVINVSGKQSKEKCYMWLYTTSMTDLPIYLYEYRYSRSGAWPKAFLKDFKGYLVVDDYAGYNHIPNVTLQKCFVHARRKFFDIFKANNDPKIKTIINLIDDIFNAERLFREDKLSANDIHLRRNTAEYRSKLEAYFNHLASLNYSPTSVTGKAVNYSLKNKVELMTYLSDGHIPIDNNLAERGIKPFVINRKNFLFSNTEKGAEASSIYMSIIQTAKTNGLDTNKYLEYLFENLYKIQIFESDYQDPVKLNDKFKMMAHLLPWDNNIKTQFKMKETSR